VRDVMAKKRYSRREIINDIRNVRNAITSEVMPKAIVEGDVRKIAQLEGRLSELEAWGISGAVRRRDVFSLQILRALKKAENRLFPYHIR
jgi:hypothetical protein